MEEWVRFLSVTILNTFSQSVVPKQLFHLLDRNYNRISPNIPLMLRADIQWYSMVWELLVK